MLASATRFEAIAASTRAGVEPELTIAIDPLVPTAPLIDSLRTLSETFPDLPVHFSTEGLGGSLRRLRSGSAAIALCLLLPGGVPLGRYDVEVDVLAGTMPLARATNGFTVRKIGRAHV